MGLMVIMVMIMVLLLLLLPQCLMIIIIRKYVSNIPGNHEVKELQKTPILGTAHILREVLT